MPHMILYLTVNLSSPLAFRGHSSIKTHNIIPVTCSRLYNIILFYLKNFGLDSVGYTF